jgi:Zn-dependent peptidase ImmA (M78 family)
MAPLTRATRIARDLTRSERLSLPVGVEKLARKYAHLIRKPLPDDVSGMLVPIDSAKADLKWAIVVNAADAPVRQRFTIAHELGHLLMHKFSKPHADGRLQVRFRDSRSTEGSVREEIEANQFAAELLMPERYVRKRAIEWGFDVLDPDLDEEVLDQLSKEARKLRVSVQALSFRIANLGLT